LRRYVLDASVIAKWHFREEFGDLAYSLLVSARAGKCQIVAPDLVLYEFASIVSKKLRAGMISAEDGQDILLKFPLAPLGLLPAVDFAPSALEAARETGATYYDSVYLAVARATKATLVTADRELVAQVRSTPLAKSVLSLADLGSDL